MEEQSIKNLKIKLMKKYNIKLNVLEYMINIIEFYNYSIDEIENLIEEYCFVKI